MCDEEGELKIKIIDFGLSLFINNDFNLIGGTVDYQSPELAQICLKYGKKLIFEIDLSKVDIYAIGMILYVITHNTKFTNQSDSILIILLINGSFFLPYS